ncbi:MAG: DUF6228 family protein [Polyangiaceae bacterium]
MAEPTFSLKSVDSSSLLEFVGAVPSGLEDWDGTSLRVALSGGPVTASVIAYDVQLHRWADFFATLASDWRSLADNLEQESLEGHVCLTASVDRRGHVSLRVRLRGVDAGWLAEGVIALEVGQLDAIAASARKFFSK